MPRPPKTRVDARASLVIEGVPELDAQLKRLGLDVGRVMFEAALRGGKVIEKEMRARAPVRTGRLKRSIFTTVVKGKHGRAFAQVGPDISRAFYGPFVNKFRPFIEPAFDAKKEEAAREAGRVVAAEIDRVTGRRG